MEVINLWNSVQCVYNKHKNIILIKHSYIKLQDF